MYSEDFGWCCTANGIAALFLICDVRWVVDKLTTSEFQNPHFQNEAKCTTFLVKMSLICMRMKNRFHIKGWALNLVLIQRPGGTRKWPIDICIQDTLSVFLAQFVCLGCIKKSLSLLFINALSVYENLNGTETRTCKNWSLSTRLISVVVADPGEGPGGPGPPPPPLFLGQTEARRVEKYFFGDRPPSLNFIRLLRVVTTPYRPPYLRV